jgi:serine/threonine protein phosphatase PrpC
MKYSVYQASRQGGRDNNEDRIGYAYSRDALLMVLADGMGGHAKGEVASQLLAQMVVKLFETQATPRLDDVTRFLLDSIFAAHEAINEHALRQGWADAPRTTCVVCVVQDGRATWAHVGDSRLYHFSHERLVSCTKDHTVLQQMLDSGLLDATRAALHPDRNKLYNCVGGFILPQIELSQPIRLQDGDVLLLASDGFWSELSQGEMLATLRAFPIDRAVEHMMDHAEFSAGERGDNLSVVAMRLGDRLPDTRTVIDPDSLGLAGFTTELYQAEGVQDVVAMSDAEIDQAIAEIQTALRKFDLNPVKKKT